MAFQNQGNFVLEEMIASLDLPSSAEEKAKSRYENLGEWFNRDASTLKDFEPRVFPQGSFRLGTTIRPLSGNDEYDLDLACELKEGITTKTYSQSDLKSLIGEELEAYRLANGIKKEIESKHRCWRLEYQDGIRFHMDIVPCISANRSDISYIQKSMVKYGSAEQIAEISAGRSVYITDDRHKNYQNICDNWNISNPEGYALWFEDKGRRSYIEKAAEVIPLKIVKNKTSLQRSIQLLKRHRDKMFEGKEDSKPISIIITTLAAKAYEGDEDLSVTVENILRKMDVLVGSKTGPRVPNPVNPKEDFADRWEMSSYRHLQLEENFFLWLAQAKIDFEHIFSTKNVTFISKQASKKFSIDLNEAFLLKHLTNGSNVPKQITHTSITQTPIKPWRE